MNLKPKVSVGYSSYMRKYAVMEKAVGETPLQALTRYKAAHPELFDVRMAYAGRLDPMASGKLLILIGDECKRQREYHGLDKEYRFEVLFGVGSDTHDVLGLLSFAEHVPTIRGPELARIARDLSGTELALPYPHFSSRTVQGKPLHMWTLEDRLDEIEIPVARTRIHSLALTSLETRTAETVYEAALAKIESIPQVTDERKALGADFRRVDVRTSWQEFLDTHRGNRFPVASFTCICSSGTYMRSLAAHLGDLFKTPALAASIQRTEVGRYRPLPFNFGFWQKRL